MNRRSFARGAASVAVALAGAASAAGNAPTDQRVAGGAERLLVVTSAPPLYAKVAHTYDLRGHLLTTVSAGPRASLAWSPDGSLLAVSDNSGVFVERVDGSGERRLLAIRTTCTSSCLQSNIAWTPDGKRLAVGGVDPRGTGFDLVGVASGNAKRLRRPRRDVLYSPIAFSPDGRLLSYALENGTAGTASCCVSALVVAHADGSQPRILHRFGDPIHDGPGAATWSPDSSRIAFTDDGRDPKDPRFAIVDVRSGKLHPLNAHHIYDQSPAWSPDGSHLALTQYDTPAFTIAASDTDFHSLGVRGTLALWLRNGDVLLAGGQSGHRVVIVRHGRGPARTLFTLPRNEQLLSFRETR